MGFKTASGTSSQYLKGNGTVATSNSMKRNYGVTTLNLSSSLNTVSLNTITANLICVGGYVIGVAINGYINNSAFPNSNNAIKSSAKVFDVKYAPPGITMLFTEQQHKSENNRVRQIWIDPDGYLWSNGLQDTAFDSTSSPFYRSSTTTYVGGGWAITPVKI
jgi:hypothetical protein